MKKAIANTLIIFICLGCGQSQTTLKTSSPEDVGMRSNRLVEALEHIQNKDYNIHSLLIARNGNIVVDCNFAPFKRDVAHEMHSITKSIVSILAGIAISEDKLSLDQKVYDFFPRVKVKSEESQKEEIEIRHLLSMTSGIDFSFIHESQPEEDIIKKMLEQPLVGQPGVDFLYDGANYHILSAILQGIYKEKLVDFADDRLFSPLGISDFSWDIDPEGTTFGGGFLKLKPVDMLKIGQLALNNGKWNGKQIVPASWIQKSTNKVTEGAFSAFNTSYGYGWWQNNLGGYNGWGTGGQYLVVLPDQGLVVAMTAGLNQEMYDVVLPEIIDFVKKSAIADSVAFPSEHYSLLQKKIAEVENPAPGKSKQLPAIARRINGKTFSLENDPFGSDNLTFKFNDSNNWVFDWGSAQVNVGTRGIFIQNTIPNPDGVRKLEIRGSWEDTNTLRIELQEIDQADRTIITFTFEENSFKAKFGSLLGKYSQQFSGKMQ